MATHGRHLETLPTRDPPHSAPYHRLLKPREGNRIQGMENILLKEKARYLNLELQSFESQIPRHQLKKNNKNLQEYVVIRAQNPIIIGPEKYNIAEAQDN